MNYVGNISIIDRGDAPAQAVIDKNVRSLAQRVADETKDELDKVMDRVDNIYVSYEMSTQTMFDNPRASPNVEYIEDIKELEEIIKDTVKKKKYQQQVTIFIVGFQDACSEKMQLLQQVNQFFLDNSKPDDEDLVEEKPEIDLDECSNKINDSLKTAEDLTKKLSDLNQDIIEWLVNWANTKASNKILQGKKRLEKSLEQAKNDMALLQEKLLNLQTELEEKDEKFQQLAKQLDAKTQEAVRYKTAAEVAKKSAQDNESHTSMLQSEINLRDEKIKELRQKLTRMEINLTESQFDTELHKKRFDNKFTEHQHKLQSLQEEVDSKKMEVIEAEREMERIHKEQLDALDKAHKDEIAELKTEHQAELTRLTEQIKSLHGRLYDAERDAQRAFDETDQLRAKILELQLYGLPGGKQDKEKSIPPSRESSAGKSYGDQSGGEDEQSKQESRPSTKDTKSSKRSEVKAKIPSRSPNRVLKERSGASRTKEVAEVSVQDENGDHLKAVVQKSSEQSRQSTRQSKNLQPVDELNINFDNVFELEDEESWASVPANQVPGRFAQYRKLSAVKLKELQDQLNITLTKTHRKVNSLKSQFNEHKKKWETERKILIEQVSQAQKLQTEAEKEADAAMTQLEEFINEQEKLEDEEESKRQEVLKAMSRPGTVAMAAPVVMETTDGDKQDSGEENLPAETSDQELKKLMQQTDDAKSRTGRALAYDSGASQLAPCLTPVGFKKAPREDPKSSTDSVSDPYSHRTDVADTEIQEIVPALENESRPSERSKSQKKRTVKDALKLPKEKHKKDRSSSPKRTRSSFQKQKLPEIRPRSFRSEGHEEEQQDSGIEQSDMSDGGMEMIAVETVARTRTFFQSQKLPEIRARSVRIEGHAEKQKDAGNELSEIAAVNMIAREMVAMEIDMRQEKSRSALSRFAENVVMEIVTKVAMELDLRQEKTGSALSRYAKNVAMEIIAREMVSMEMGIRQENVGSILLRSAEVRRSSAAKSHSESPKSSSDDYKMQYFDSVTPFASKTRSISRKTSLREQDQMSQMTSSEPVDLDLLSGLSGDENDCEEELNVTGMSVVDGESVTDDVKTSRSFRQKSSRDFDEVGKGLRKSMLSGRDSVRSGAQLNLGRHYKDTPQTIQSQRCPSETPASTGSPRKIIVIVDVMQGQEAQASRTSGAVSAPPAIEPDEDVHHKEPKTVREDYESRPISRGKMREATLSTESGISAPPSAGPKKAFGTPRPPTISPSSLRLSSGSSSTMSEVDHDLDEDHDIDLAPTQSEALESLKKIMSEESLTTDQQQTLNDMRSALKSVSEREALKDGQLERTVTILSLASQIAHESKELGIVPDSIFNSFANMDSGAMSWLTDSMSVKGHSARQDKEWSAGTEKLLRSRRTEPVIMLTERGPKSRIEHEPVTGKTEEEIRASSAKSRASLRKEFKSRLEETRTVVEDRRAKSPVISLPSQKSLDEDQLIVDEEEDDEDLPIPDDMKVEDIKDETLDAGTSPPPKPGKHAETQVSRSASKQSVNIAEHPVVQEYLKTYRGVHNFKDTISRLLEDKDQMSASQILADIDTVPFDQSTKVQPQLENMTDNVYYVLNEVSQVINSIIHNDRGPVVSSLMMGMSRDPTQRSMIRERSSESVDVRHSTQQSQRSVKVGPSPGVDRQQHKELQEKYEMFNIDVQITPRQGQFSEEAKKYEEQLRHNTVVMMEMQDTINELQRELSALGKPLRRPLSDTMSTPGGSQTAESAVMFTRLDSERNAKIMKKAVNDQKLDPNSYKEAMVQMDEYVNLPAQRLAHLVRKYVHHCRMKEIEENVKNSKSLNENVFNILDKMEELQNQRAKRWADRMDEMGIERLRIASQLMETLDSIEQQSGLFLIKPMYSYRGREPKVHYAGKVSRPYRPTRVVSPLREVQSAYAPAPTPASNMRTVVRKQAEVHPISQEQPLTAVVRTEPPRPLEGDSQGLMGSSVHYVGTQPKATWSMSDSQPRIDPSLMTASFNTPRILELDINRMMIGQNTISAQIGSQGLSNDRLVNASNSNLRSYMTVNRPAVGPSGSSGRERPTSGNKGQESPGQPSSPISSGKGVRIPNESQFSSTPPLPPIGSGRMTPKEGKGRAPSVSPPGSSLRQTPPGTDINVEISTIK